MTVRLHLPLFALAALAVLASSAAEGLRNPFWPKGYEGERTPISAEVRPKPKPKPVPKPAEVKPKPDPKVAAEAKAKAEKEAAAKAAAEKAAAEKSAKEAAAKAAAEKAAKEAAEKEAERKREITSADWRKAMKTLKIGNPAVFKSEDGKTRSTISINGNIYVDGDRMSVTTGGIRFTWRIRGLDDGDRKLRLERVRARRVE